MKKLDYIVLSILVLVDVLLFTMRGCILDILLVILWLGVIAAFVIILNHMDRKKKQRESEAETPIARL